MNNDKPSRRRRHNIQQFEKGINQRVNIEKGDATRLHKLQNARLQGRGNTLSVVRLKGYDVVIDLPDDVVQVFDVVYGPNNDLVVFSELAGDNLRVSVYNETFELVDEWAFDGDVEYGQLLRKDDTILISPVNKIRYKILKYGYSKKIY